MIDQSQPGRLVRLIRWTARISSIASVGLLLAFVMGEGISPTTQAERLGLLFFPLGVCVGMLIGWRKERLGGLITVGSLVFFYIVSISMTGELPKGWAWLAFAAPGFLFLVAGCWRGKRRATAA